MKCRVNGCCQKGEFENGICPKCVKKLKSTKKRKPVSKKSSRNYPKLLRKAKELFQKLRRLQEADDNGIVKCVHGGVMHYTKCDGGHYYPAHYLKTCFDPKNVHPQEKRKNMDMHNPETQREYREFLIKKIGLKEVENLDQTYRMPCKLSTIELEAMIDYYGNEIEKELKRLK